jgi:hypothetical protein
MLYTPAATAKTIIPSKFVSVRGNRRHVPMMSSVGQNAVSRLVRASIDERRLCHKLAVPKDSHDSDSLV